MIGKQMNLFDDVDSAEVSQEDLEYENFVEKFKPKKTTDDCYTPPLIYETVKDWACTKYGIDPDRIVRPFWPGADYKVFPYPEGCVVLDNPPFSILSQIIEFYQRRSIPFFLFAPSLTVFSGRTSVMKTNHIVCGANVTYENGAVVRTAFITSFGGDIVAQTAPDLGRAISDASAILRPASAIPCYEYPPNVLTAAMLQRLSKYGIEFSVRASDCIHIRALDSQKAARKEIFGSGLLLSESSAAEKAIAEKLAEAAATAQKEAPTVWELSARELRIIAGLSGMEVPVCDSLEEDPDAITFFEEVPYVQTQNDAGAGGGKCQEGLPAGSEAPAGEA